MRMVEIKGSQMDLTEAIKAYVEERLAGVSKFCENFEPCDVRVDVGKTTQHHQKGEVFFAEFNLTIPGTLLRAEARMDDLYAAIDKAATELRRQVKSYKEKLRDADRVVMDTTVEEHTWSSEEEEK